MTGHHNTPLASCGVWPRELIEKLGRAWMTTAEQVVAVAATPGGIASLANQLGVSESEVARLIAKTEARLPPETRRALKRPVDTTEYGLGARDPGSMDEE